MKKRYFIILAFLSTLSISAQELGVHSPKIQWRVIENETVKVIYADGTGDQAKRIADVITYLRKNQKVSVGEKSRKIPIILQNEQTVSNGFVTLAPFRSEFFMISPQDQTRLGSTDWLDLLAVHEYRHALQYANINRGLTKFFHIIGGEYGWAGAQGLSVPNWYMEGDAVMSETILSDNGRGRNPYFFKEQRALFLADEIYSYHKARNGSFKDLVPSHYQTGYMISNYLRNNFEVTTGAKILADAGKYKYGFYPFSSAMKHHTGLRTKKMYKTSAKDLKERWINEQGNLNLSSYENLTKTPKTITNYTFPSVLEDGSIVAIKKSYKKTPRVVKINNGKEKVIATIGVAAEEFLAVSKKILVWTEHHKDVRFANKNYNDIVVFDMANNSKKMLTKNKRYFSPSISPDASKITTVKYLENGTYAITILDAKNGEPIYVLPNEKKYFLSTPKFTEDGNSIVFLAKEKSRLAFFKYSLTDQKMLQISNWTTATIGQFHISEEKIYFSAAFTGIDNIYSIAMDGTRNIVQLSSVPVGAYYPFYDKEKQVLLFSNFTQKGFQLSQLKLPENQQSFVLPNLKENKYYQLKITGTEHAILDSIPANQYTPKNYTSSGIKLHTWGLTTSSTATNSYGVNLIFQNLLTNFQADAAYLYNVNEKRGSITASVDYGKYFIHLNAAIQNQQRSAYAHYFDIPTIQNFNENAFSVGFKIPLSQYKGNYIQSLKVESNFAARYATNYSLEGFAFEDFNLSAIESRLTLTNVRQMAKQNVAPRFGQLIRLDYNKGISGATAEKFAVFSKFFFPGIGANHSLNFDLNYQKELLGNAYQYSDYFTYARGYEVGWNDEVSKFSVNYELPILYPDFGVFGITYFKRMRLNMFFDTSVLAAYSYTIETLGTQQVLRTTKQDIAQRSYGGELFLDNVWFNRAPLSLGFRQSVLLDEDRYAPGRKLAFEVLIRVGF